MTTPAARPEQLVEHPEEVVEYMKAEAEDEQAAVTSSSEEEEAGGSDGGVLAGFIESGESSDQDAEWMPSPGNHHLGSKTLGSGGKRPSCSQPSDSDVSTEDSECAELREKMAELGIQGDQVLDTR